MINEERDILKWMQSWYYQYCDEDWEHDERIVIENIDNPGWLVSINVEGTDCEEKDFTNVKVDNSEHDWYHCSVRDNKFKGAGGPFNLGDILQAFKVWTELE